MLYILDNNNKYVSFLDLFLTDAPQIRYSVWFFLHLIDIDVTNVCMYVLLLLLLLLLLTEAQQQLNFN